MHILLVDSKLCIGMYIPDGDTSKELPAYLCERRHNQRFIPYVNCLHQPAFEIALKTVGKYLNTARGFEIEKQIKKYFLYISTLPNNACWYLGELVDYYHHYQE